MLKINKLILLLGIIFAALSLGKVLAYDLKDIVEADKVGEVFGEAVPKEEFFRNFKTALIFTRTGNSENRIDEDRRQEAWQNLVFAREARSIGMKVSPEDLKKEIIRLLSEKKLEYGSKEYEAFVLQNFGEDVESFQRRIEDLMLINRLIKEKTDVEVKVTDAEAKEKFLNQYNSFESEYISFESADAARKFVEEVKKKPALWKETFDGKKKAFGQKGAAWINIMSMEALIDLWKIPKNDAYKILNANIGDFIAVKNYYGDAVFRLLYKRKANEKEYDQKKKEYYLDMLTKQKKYVIANTYLTELFKRANIKDYLKEKEDLRKKEVLKQKSLVEIETNRGKIEVRLFPDIAPLACENFVGLIEKGDYNNLIFHRVIKDFMIQGGDPTGTGAGGESIWGRPFQDEISKDKDFSKPGMLAMANSGPDSNKSQFFITTAPAPWLNGRHTIFGEVIKGMEVVKKIVLTPTGANDKPKAEQKIIKINIKL